MEEQKVIQLAKVDPVEEQKKVEAWGKYGSVLYKSQIALQAQAQEIIGKLIDPTTTDLIAKAEQAYAEVKKEHAELVKKRIVITSKFDPVLARMSAPEKSIAQQLQLNAEAILKAKQREKEAAKTKEAKEKELRKIGEQVRIYVADMHAAYLYSQLKTLNAAYEHALANNITVEELPEFKAKVCARVNLANRQTPPPKPQFQYCTQEEVDAEVAKNFTPWPAEEYVSGFAADVENKFIDWQQALKDKQAAKELNEQETKQTEAAISEQKQKETIAANLEALAVPIAEATGTKALKEVWTIKEPETIAEAFTIINAFAVNRNLVEEKLRKITPVNLSVKQMVAALLAVKTDDPNFECTGIAFIKIDKL